MYLSHYGLARPPFDPAPQSDALFETATHNEALAAVVYGVLEAKGFIAVVGEVGVGKTTVLRRALAYVRTVDPSLLIVEIANPGLAPVALLQRIQRTLELDGRATSARGDLEPIEAALRRLAATGRRLLLVIDEAQSLAAPTLELLRILSNLDGGGRPLVQTVFSGQPEFDQLLADPAQRALRQRIAVRAHIRPLGRREMTAYLAFRLAAAGAPGGVMRRGAVRAIARASGGFPRRANIIADNALIAGFGANVKPIGRRAVARALAALDAGEPARRTRRFGFRLAWGSAAALALAALGWAGLPSAPARVPGAAASLTILAAPPPAPAGAPERVTAP
jgi:general secretion pathway protein A